MSKYINADTVIQALRETIDRYKDSEMFTRTVRAAENMILIIDRMPAADVVEVETLKKNIEANLDEARKLRDEHSSELIRAFQQGRMFGHECDLEMIKRGETE